MIAAASGYSHDIGKAGSYFVEKLQRAANGHRVEADPVRHEWISMKVMERMLQGDALEDALRTLTNKALAEKPAFHKGAGSIADVLLYICATHHRLFGPSLTPKVSTLTRLDTTNHVSVHRSAFTYPSAPDKVLGDDFSEALADRLQKLNLAANESSQTEPYWYGIAWLARVALILADHGVSSMLGGTCGENGQRHAISPDSPGLYANTWPKHADVPSLGYNQRLEDHLIAVADKAQEIANAMCQMSLPSLNAKQVRAILTPAQEGPGAERFAWQDKAVESIQQWRKATDAPLLIFNIASTGAGKTVMNIKAACAAALGAPRLSYALNLRTLTLQTGGALKRDFLLGRDSVATVIGDQVTTRLHESEHTAANPQHSAGDMADVFDDVEIQVDGGTHQLPGWLSPITDKRPEWRAILASPVLVSTIDFLVQAGEPGRQGHHAAALLRLMHSDLILDEVDSYDTESLVAILRLIQVAAQLGRNVICSSATLPWPIAYAVAEAYQSGHQVYAALNGRVPNKGVVVLNDLLQPRWYTAELSFSDYYRFILKDLSAHPVPVTKRPILQKIDRTSGLSGFFNAIKQGVEQLHADNQWTFRGGDKKVSFGLVRVANIQTANEVAEELQALPGTYVCLYHARDFVIQRHLKEKALDSLLCRKTGNQSIDQDPIIQAICDETSAQPLRFVVVATPVEEVGRDHDFDWAVIEPSGSHSIIQTAGRVNRHRRELVNQPNIAVLQYNMRAMRAEKVVFTRPGPESGKGFSDRPNLKNHYPDLEKLLNWKKINQLTAAMAFDTEHLMVQGEHHIQQELLKKPLKVLKRDKGYENIWMTNLFYSKYPLRRSQNDQLEDWRVLPRNGGGVQWERRVRNGFTFSFQEKRNQQPDMKQTNWLSWTIEQLWEACEAAGITREEGMRIKIRASKTRV